jgi:ABC-type bacteriocin/lantibiotic exporter with double-glycine peptidase domain
MVLLALGDDASEDQLVQLLAIEWYGTPASRIQRLAQRGYRVTYEQTTLEQLQDYVQQQSPVLVFLRTGGLLGWREDVAHAVVLVGLTADVAFVHDPAHDTGPDEISLDAFLLAWSEMDYYCAAIVRA